MVWIFISLAMFNVDAFRSSTPFLCKTTCIVTGRREHSVSLLIWIQVPVALVYNVQNLLQGGKVLCRTRLQDGLVAKKIR